MLAVSRLVTLSGRISLARSAAASGARRDGAVPRAFVDERPLRPGDVVEVRPAAEILATLDKEGALEGMLFMPEMLAHIGRRYTVTRRVDKICNTVDTSGSRRMRETVYLGDLRCSGAGHGGCQAECKIYWKEAWLRRVEPDSDGVAKNDPDIVALRDLAVAATRTVREVAGSRCETWRCQATDALEASVPLRRLDIRQYWRELTNGNFGLLRFARIAFPAFLMDVAFLFGLVKPLPLRGPTDHPAPAPPLGLNAGDVVQVRAPKEIAATLDRCGFNRGLSFDREMLPYCGRTFRVRSRARKIIDDKTGRMLTLPKDSIVLEGVVCSGERSVFRTFCPREIYPFWRESWLRRVEGSDAAAIGRDPVTTPQVDAAPPPATSEPRESSR
jgi:hypothetical protein